MIDNPSTQLSPRLRQDLYQRLASAKQRLYWSGIAMAVVGALSFIFPVIGTLSVEILVGWTLLFAGVITAFGAFQIHGTGPFFGQLLIGLLNTAVGLYFLTHPGVGIIALTIVLAIAFVVDGTWQIGLALELRPRDGWGWIMASGAVSIAAGLIIAAGLPGTSLFAIGLLLGLNFMTTGLALTLLATKIDPADLTKRQA